jgi:hypothetical protein
MTPTPGSESHIVRVYQWGPLSLRFAVLSVWGCPVLQWEARLTTRRLCCSLVVSRGPL